MAPMPEMLAPLLSYGLAGAFMLTLLEKFVPIVPSYILLMVFGMSAQDGLGLTHLLGVTAAGSLCGSAGWLMIGRALGGRRVEAMVARFGKYLFFPLSTYHRLAAAYRRSHFRVTMIGHTVPIARVYLGLPAGVLGLPVGRFLGAATLGILVWNLTFLTLGFLLAGSPYSLVKTGLWASAALILTEMTILVVARAIARRRRA